MDKQSLAEFDYSINCTNCGAEWSQVKHYHGYYGRGKICFSTQKKFDDVLISNLRHWSSSIHVNGFRQRIDAILKYINLRNSPRNMLIFFKAKINWFWLWLIILNEFLFNFQMAYLMVWVIRKQYRFDDLTSDTIISKPCLIFGWKTLIRLFLRFKFALVQILSKWICSVGHKGCGLSFYKGDLSECSN